MLYLSLFVILLQPYDAFKERKKEKGRKAKWFARRTDFIHMKVSAKLNKTSSQKRPAYTIQHDLWFIACHDLLHAIEALCSDTVIWATGLVCKIWCIKILLHYCTLRASPPLWEPVWIFFKLEMCLCILNQGPFSIEMFTVCGAWPMTQSGEYPMTWSALMLSGLQLCLQAVWKVLMYSKAQLCSPASDMEHRSLIHALCHLFINTAILLVCQGFNET